VFSTEDSIFAFQEIFLNVGKMSVVAHTCKHSYLGGRDGRIESLRTDQANVVRPYLKKN
jgi:hypothetical protein